ncbi:7015_t:CDS:1, partial [Acaulospora morrowiae]
PCRAQFEHLVASNDNEGNASNIVNRWDQCHNHQQWGRRPESKSPVRSLHEALLNEFTAYNE